MLFTLVVGGTVLLGTFLSVLVAIPYLYASIVTTRTNRIYEKILDKRIAEKEAIIERNFKEQEEYMKKHGRDVIREEYEGEFIIRYHLNGTVSKVYNDALI